MYEEDEEFGLHARRFEGIAWRVGEGSWELGSEVRGLGAVSSAWLTIPFGPTRAMVRVHEKRSVPYMLLKKT